MKFLDKLLALIFFGAAATFFAVNSIFIIIAIVGGIIDMAKNSYFNGTIISLFLGLAACVLIILISVFAGLKILQGEKLRGINLFKSLVSVAIVYAAVTTVTSIIELIVGIANNYGGTYIANEIIDVVLFAGAAVTGVLAYLAKEIDFQKKLYAMISFGLCGLAVFIGWFFGFSVLGLFLFSIWALGVVIMVLNKFEESNA